MKYKRAKKQVHNRRSKRRTRTAK